MSTSSETVVCIEQVLQIICTTTTTTTTTTTPV